MTPKLNSTAPILQVNDVGPTMAWYQEHLGFTADPFPRQPPHVFCILWRDAVEIMLQKVDDAHPLDVYRHRSGGAWHVYLRVNGVDALYDSLKDKPAVPVLEKPHNQPYNNREFVVRDPNGYVLVFSGEVPSVTR
jgi:catechol 2,3-dioxygenase-like lactoylglutathione lyase family enzyme